MAQEPEGKKIIIAEKALIDALSKGNIPEVIRLIDAEGADVNTILDENGYTPLLMAVYHANEPMVEALLNRGADVNMQLNSGPLTVQNTSILNMLEMAPHTQKLKIPANASMQEIDTAFRRLALPLHPDRNIGVDTQQIEQNKLDFETITQAKEKLIEIHRKKFLIAAAQGDLSMIKKNIAEGKFAQDNRGITPLMLASKGGHTDIVTELINARVDLNATDEQGLTALMYATRAKKKEIADLLIENGANTSLKHVPHFLAIDGIGNEERTALVRERMAKTAAEMAPAPTMPETASEQERALISGMKDASRAINAEALIAAVVGAGGNINVQDLEGTTALMWAVRTQGADAVNALMGAGVQLDIQDNRGMTALMYALQMERQDVIHSLLAAGADTTLVGKLGLGDTTATTIALDKSIAGIGDVAKKQLLEKLKLAESADDVQEIIRRTEASGFNKEEVLNGKDDDGMTALAYAVQGGNGDKIMTLLNVGATIDQGEVEADKMELFLEVSRKYQLLETLRDVVDSSNANDLQSRINGASSTGGVGEIVDIQDHNGQTLLMKAATHNDEEMVKILLGAGANAIIANNAIGEGTVTYKADIKQIIEVASGQRLDAILKRVRERREAEVPPPEAEQPVDDQQAVAEEVEIDAPLPPSEEELKRVILQLLPLAIGADLPEALSAVKDLQEAAINNKISLDRRKQAINILNNIDRNILNVLPEVAREANDAVKNILTHKAAALIAAVKNGDVQSMNGLMAAARDEGLALREIVNTTDQQGMTALHWAAQVGGERAQEIIGQLIAAGAKIEARNSLGRTPLIIAAWRGNTGALNSIIAQNPDIEARDRDRWTALLQAAASGNKENVEALINKGASVNVKDNVEMTPLHWAVRENFTPELVDLLINHGAELNARDHTGMTPLHWAVASDAGAVEMLVDRGVNIDAKNDAGETSLMFAIRQGDVRIAAYLISQGASLEATNNRGETSLHMMSTHCAENLMNSLNTSAEVEGIGRTEKSRLTRASTKLDRMVKATQKLLTQAQQQGGNIRAAIREVQAAGGSLDAKNENGNTSLMVVVHTGNKVAVKELIKAGASVFVKNADGNTAVDLAGSVAPPGGQEGPVTPEKPDLLKILREEEMKQAPGVMRIAAEELSRSYGKIGGGDANEVAKTEAYKKFMAECATTMATQFDFKTTDERNAKIAEVVEASVTPDDDGNMPAMKALEDHLKGVAKSKTCRGMVSGRNMGKIACIAGLVAIGAVVAMVGLSYGLGLVTNIGLKSVAGHVIMEGWGSALSSIPKTTLAALIMPVAGALGLGIIGRRAAPHSTSQKEEKNLEKNLGRLAESFRTEFKKPQQGADLQAI